MSLVTNYTHDRMLNIPLSFTFGGSARAIIISSFQWYQFNNFWELFACVTSFQTCNICAMMNLVQFTIEMWSHNSCRYIATNVTCHFAVADRTHHAITCSCIINAVLQILDARMIVKLHSTFHSVQIISHHVRIPNKLK